MGKPLQGEMADSDGSASHLRDLRENDPNRKRHPRSLQVGSGHSGWVIHHGFNAGRYCRAPQGPSYMRLQLIESIIGVIWRLHLLFFHTIRRRATDHWPLASLLLHLSSSSPPACYG